jgi:integrase
MPRERREIAWCRREPNGKPYVYWTERVDGKTRTKRESLERKYGKIETEQDLQSKYAKWLVANLSKYADGGQSAGKLTVSMVLGRYWEDHAQKQISSRSIGMRIDRLKEGLGSMAVNDLTMRHTSEYVEKRESGTLSAKKSAQYADKPVGSGTIRGELGTLTAAIRHAIRWRYLDASAMPTIVLPAAPDPKPLWLYPNELKRLFVAGEGTEIGDFCKIAYYTGARRASVENLTVFQVSLERNRIALDAAGAVRTKKRRPTVPIAKALRPTIERRLQIATNTYLLGSNRDRMDQFNVLIVKAGLAMLPERDMRPAGKPTPHTLRHSRATHLLQAGVSPWAVAQLLGDRLETVTRVYGHWCGDHLEQALEGVADIGA